MIVPVNVRLPIIRSAGFAYGTIGVYGMPLPYTAPSITPAAAAGPLSLVSRASFPLPATLTTTFSGGQVFGPTTGGIVSVASLTHTAAVSWATTGTVYVPSIFNSLNFVQSLGSAGSPTWVATDLLTSSYAILAGPGGRALLDVTWPTNTASATYADWIQDEGSDSTQYVAVSRLTSEWEEAYESYFELISAAVPDLTEIDVGQVAHASLRVNRLDRGEPVFNGEVGHTWQGRDAAHTDSFFFWLEQAQLSRYISLSGPPYAKEEVPSLTWRPTGIMTVVPGGALAVGSYYTASSANTPGNGEFRDLYMSEVYNSYLNAITGPVDQWSPLFRLRGGRGSKVAPDSPGWLLRLALDFWRPIR